MKLKLKMYKKILVRIRKCLILTIIKKSKYYDDSNKLVAGKMKDEAGGVAVKEFVGLKPKMYLFLADGSGEHKK